MSFEISQEELDELRKSIPHSITVRKPAPWEFPMQVLSDTCDGIHPIFTPYYKRTINGSIDSEETPIP